MIFALLTLISALSLASVTEWFSIIGFMAIYAGAPMHALIMGAALGAGKLVATSWLYRNWAFSDWRIKIPLMTFTLILMIITSIGVYGFLSKGHLDHGAGTIDNSAKVERLDQQIAREKSIIADDEKVIGQLDATINSYIGKDRTDKSLAVRKAQAPQRKQLRIDIKAAQKRIDEFSDEKLKLQSEVRKQELDVGPIRYISELLYGVENDANKNIEAAIRMFTLLIVSVLDPLAVTLLIAANHTLLRLKNEKEEKAGSKQTRDKQTDTDNMSSETVGEKNSPDLETGAVISPSIRSYDSSPTKDPTEETIFFPVLPEVMGQINETQEKHNEQTEVYTPTSVQQILQAHPEHTTILDQDNKSNRLASHHRQDASPIQKSEIEESEDLILVKELPLPIIRSPVLTQVSIRKTISSTEITEPVAEVTAPIMQAETTVPNAENNPNSIIVRELLGNNPHIVLRRDHNETPVNIPINSQETAELHKIDNVTDLSDTGNKYPKALSWLEEFKRS